MSTEPGTGSPRGAADVPPVPPRHRPWAAAVGRASQERADRVTGRLRRTVDDLPDWDPLPPGESLVRRPGGAG